MHFKLATTILILAQFVIALSSAAQAEIRSEPYRLSKGNIGAETRFTRLDSSLTSIRYQHQIATWHPDKRLLYSSFACGAPVIGDLDLDGQPDLFITGGPGSNKLYLQAGNLSFVDITANRPLAGHNLWASGGVMVDIDNDGDLDIYVCYYDSPNQLFINQIRESGQLKFEERASDYGLDITDASLVPAFGDYDADGDLDLFLLTHQLYRSGGRPATNILVKGATTRSKPRIDDANERYYVIDTEDEEGKWSYKEQGRVDYLLRNDNGKFVDVSEQAGIPKIAGVGNSATWWDYDHDGDIDLYIGNDRLDPDYLYKNNGDGTFVEELSNSFPRSTLFTKGATITDLNNDGRTDFIAADILPSTHYKQKTSAALTEKIRSSLAAAPGVRQVSLNGVYLNSGHGAFRDTAILSGLAETDWTWTIKSGDYDQDGRLDLFFANGAARKFDSPEVSTDHRQLVGSEHWELYEKAVAPKLEQNIVYRNIADFQFEDVSENWGLDHHGMTYTCSQGDLDNDGDLDLVTCSLDENVYIYRNDGKSGASIKIRLIGKQSNRMGVGAEVRVQTAKGVQARQHFISSGFMSADLAEIHFGFGSERTIQQLQVRWPSGLTQTFEDLKVNQTYTITESGTPSVPNSTSNAHWFVEDNSLEEEGHSEEEFDDFARQPLLPWKLSQFGPPMAWGDIDGDGVDDLYLGGSAGRSGRLLYNKTSKGGSPTFKRWVQQAMIGDKACEDMGALFFDADSDGDLDLYVASGSVEAEPGSQELRDRLYLNNGSGTLRKSSDSLPDLRESSSSVSAADFDRDGDLDLFIGVRSIIGAYPKPTTSRLLLNEEGRFRDATEELAPSLIDLGLVTSATWSDYDNDGWIDLIIATDWGPIQFFKNQNGLLGSVDVGIKDILGWWNAIAGADIDNDGDIDYVATNFGSNIQYQASNAAPALIFYGDMDGSGVNHIVEAMFEDNVCYPWRGMRSTTTAMPNLAEKVNNSAHEFAQSSLSAIYSVDTLQKATIVKATELRSGMFVNDGNGLFEFVPLPQIAQIAPGFGLAMSDFNLDGLVDCYIAQNFLGPQTETAPMISGFGQLLRRNPNGNVTPQQLLIPVEPRDSGMLVRGDAKAVSVVDINRDQVPDIVVGINNQAPQVYINQSVDPAESLRIRLKGFDGNSEAIGARVKLEIANVPTQIKEVAAGNGFLSQSTSKIYFARPASVTGDAKVEVRWPDGKTEEHVFPASESEFVVEQKLPEPPPEEEESDESVEDADV
ncbi:MAG: FG-GAP-like repeat-containing protein [Verrucomicrobiota bacterium]